VADRCSHIEARRDCRIVITTKEYREYAGDCLRWAREAKTEEQRRLLFDMAKYWVGAAEQAAGSVTTTNEPKSELQ